MRSPWKKSKTAAAERLGYPRVSSDLHTIISERPWQSAPVRYLAIALGPGVSGSICTAKGKKRERAGTH